MKDIIIIHDPTYAGWIFDETHPTQGRRFINGHNAITMHAQAAGLTIETRQPAPATREDLLTMHAPGYISDVLDRHHSGEWVGKRPDMSALASLFVGGTLTALGALTRNETLTAVHLPGAKHHAMYDRSSGFCVFADFAIAATRLTAEGKKVAIFDLDAHHGDGTEKLTYTNPHVLTYSVHQDGIFPGTGNIEDPAMGVFNYPLGAGDGDRVLRLAARDFLTAAAAFRPDYVFIAGGADGHQRDPLSDLMYSLDGFEQAAEMIRSALPVTPILFGGAGGYQPDGATPLAWARMVTALAR